MRVAVGVRVAVAGRGVTVGRVPLAGVAAVGVASAGLVGVAGGKIVGVVGVVAGAPAVGVKTRVTSGTTDGVTGAVALNVNVGKSTIVGVTGSVVVSVNDGGVVVGMTKDVVVVVTGIRSPTAGKKSRNVWFGAVRAGACAPPSTVRSVSVTATRLPTASSAKR